MTSDHDLIAAYMDGSISNEEFQHLQSRLKANPELLKLYLDHSIDDHLLADLYQVTRRMKPTLDSLSTRGTGRILRQSVLAAAACLALGLIVLWIQRVRSPELMAELRFREHSIWYYDSPDGGRDRNQGGSLPVGRMLHLEEGSLQARLSSGVTALIEGPAELRLDNENSLFLKRGRGRFNVPPPATGFSVRTSRHQIVDLGTEFGVLEQLNPARTEVHVFRGKVACSKIDGGQRREIEAGRALTINVAGRIQSMTAVPDDFPSEMATEVEVILADDFEEGLQDNEAIENRPPSGWTRISPRGDQGVVVGLFNPDPDKQWYSNPDLLDTESSGGMTGAMKGPGMAYIYKSPAGTGIMRTVGTFVPENSYTLTLGIGHRPQVGPRGERVRFGGYTVQLLSGSEVLAELSSDIPPSEPDSVGLVQLKWSPVNDSASVPASGPLTIRIVVNHGDYLDVDNVRLIRIGNGLRQSD